MAVLKREDHMSVSIADTLTVLSYTRPSDADPAVVVPRVDLTNITGGGIYTAHALIDGNQVTPKSAITFDAGQTKGVLQGREITVEPGDALTVTVKGQSGDTAVNVSAMLFDNTPLNSDALEGITGSGSVMVDHNYGGTDNLRYETSLGVGIGDAMIRCYHLGDFRSNRRGREYIVAEIRTVTTGRWSTPMMLDPGQYVLVFYKRDAYGPDVRQLTVS